MYLDLTFMRVKGNIFASSAECPISAVHASLVYVIPYGDSADSTSRACCDGCIATST